MTKLPTSPDALRRLARAIERRDTIASLARARRNAVMNISWTAAHHGDLDFSGALSAAMAENWDLLVTAALADFDKEVLAAHAAVQDSIEEKS